MKSYRTSCGQVIRPAGILGRGGEGIVYSVDGDPDIAIKIYTDGKRKERQPKIASMVANQLYRSSNLVAFPIDLLFDDAGEFAGFTMQKADGVKPLHELYAPGSRRIEFPLAEFRFLARTATNIARALASIHQTACVIGDINHSGILVSPKAVVTLIDSDSFQVRSGSEIFRCRVGVGEYTPPELQGLALETVDREPHHDAFGLAVIVFQLLFVGRHPFAGRYAGPGDMPIERAIKEGRFAYSSRSGETRMEPPPFVPTLTDVTPEVAQAFEKAFSGDGSQFDRRPAPAEWVSLLEKFEAELIPCQFDSSHHHPKSVTHCPWCRLESQGSAALFPFAGLSLTSASSNFSVTSILAAIANVAGPGQAPDPLTVLNAPTGLSPSSAAKSAKRALWARRTLGFIISAIAVIITAAGFPLAMLGFLLGVFLTIGGKDPYASLRAAKRSAESEWQLAVYEWKQEAGNLSFKKKKDELRKLASEYTNLPIIEKTRLEDLDKKRRDIQLQRFLEGHLLARSKIPGIGDERKAVLASYGIENAFDVTRRAVLNVPGFGQGLTSKLIDWRNAIERKFVFNPSLGIDPASIRKVKEGIARRRVTIERTLTRGLSDLEQIKAGALRRQTQPPQKLIEAYRSLKQAELDLA